MAEGIYAPDGTLIPFSGADLSTELATRQNAGVFFGELEGWLNTLPDPDPVLRKRGDDAAILRELTADDQVTTAMLSRKNRVLNCPHFAFRAGAPEGETPTPEAEELHRRFMRDLERTNLRTIISGMLDAPFYGFTPLELIWRRGDDWWHLGLQHHRRAGLLLRRLPQSGLRLHTGRPVCRQYRQPAHRSGL